jgi:phytoene dehydrogenase-like protein
MPPVMVAHPFDDGSPALVYRSIERTAEGLGSDGKTYAATFSWLMDVWRDIEDAVLGPLGWPRHPLTLARFGLSALQSAERFAKMRFRGDRARALFCGTAAHSILPLDAPLTAGVGLTLHLLAHLVGWCFPRGGAQQLTNALAAHLRSLGGEVVTGHPVDSIDELPPARAILCDLSPRPFLRIAGHRLPPGFRRALERYRYGPAAFKVDWALDGPIPWRNPECALAATVHLGGTRQEIALSERGVWQAQHMDRPFVLLTQPTLFDPSRAPAGKHVAWAYCHVPNGSDLDMVPRIERQIERFAPGFSDRILARVATTPSELAERNANYVGGDIAAGVTDFRQFFARPTWRTYSTPINGMYLCSAATPPGVGVHGMCGYHAAKRALREVW